jgi:hypothetical protein
VAAIVLVFLESEKIGGGEREREREREVWFSGKRRRGRGRLAYVMLFEREKGGLFLG